MTGEELRAIRKARNLTLVQFAALLGYAPNHIYRLERGHAIKNGITISKRLENLIRRTFPEKKVKESA